MTVPRQIVEDWRGMFEVAIEMKQLLEAIAEVGAAGGGVAKATRRAALSESTIRRQLVAASLPGAAWLLRDARLRAVRVRVRLGWSATDAVRAGGWANMHMYRKVRSRHPD